MVRNTRSFTELVLLPNLHVIRDDIDSILSTIEILSRLRATQKVMLDLR
jgi:hypothetical protein